MIKGKQKKNKRTDKQPRSPSLVSPSRKPTEGILPPTGIAKLDPDKTVIATKEIFIEAPAKHCFDTLSKQLEQTPQWDPIIVDASPVSDNRRQTGAASKLILDLGGRRLASQAVVLRYRPNGSLSWVLCERPKVREDWRLEPKPRGTLVRVNLAQELNGWALGRFIYKVIHGNRVEQDLNTMLVQLKAAIESTKGNLSYQ